jgi:hypothetical protein
VFAPEQAGTKASLSENHQFIGVHSAECTDPYHYCACGVWAWKNGMVSVGDIEPVDVDVTTSMNGSTP